MRAFDRERYLTLVGHLEASGYIVHNAHLRESWGANFRSPEARTRMNYEQIRDCDLFVAFPGRPVSPGTHIEIGWATAFGKPLMLLLEAGYTYASLVQGLHAVSDVTYVSMPAAELGQPEFAAALEEFETRHDARRRTERTVSEETG